MKLRIRHNSLRLRVGKAEVELLRQGTECREVVFFPGGERLEYALTSSTEEAISASFSERLIHVRVPHDQLTYWCASEQVGLATEIRVPDGMPLRVLIEKDFRCMDPDVTEDQSDAFDNPLAHHPGCAAEP